MTTALLNIVKEQGIVNKIMELKIEMEELDREEYEDFLFHISLINFDKLKLKDMKTWLNKSNKYFKITGYKRMNKKTLRDTLISRTKILLL